MLKLTLLIRFKSANKMRNKKAVDLTLFNFKKALLHSGAAEMFGTVHSSLSATALKYWPTGVNGVDTTVSFYSSE